MVVVVVVVVVVLFLRVVALVFSTELTPHTH